VAELLRLFRREGRKLDSELAALIVMQIAGGLNAAHETIDQDGQRLDIVHRDISPSNILLSGDGNAKLIDFGIAKARNRLSETEAGVALKGKYKYIAPEQATRNTVDRRSDIFSLGVVFWEMLVGQPLFTEDTHVALFNRLHRTDVAPPSSVNPDALMILDPIVMSMLQHDPAARPQTAADVQRRIASVLPAAANRDPAELGALAMEVRDKRASRRATQTETPGSDASLSPVSRSSLRARSEDYHIEIEAMPSLRPHTPSPTMPTASVPWSRRAVQISIIGLLGIGITVGVLLGRQSGTAAPPETARAAETAAPAAPKPADPPAPVVTPLVPAAEPPAPPQPPADPQVVATDVPPPSEPVTPHAVTASPAPIATPSPARRELVRVPPKTRPVRRPNQPDGEVTKTVPQLPPATTFRSGDTPFANGSFDDANNTGVAPAAPNRTKVKKTPIVTNFGN
jgi:serine/threonine-protein kinase